MALVKKKNSDEKDILSEEDNRFDEPLEMPTKEDVFERFLDIPGINEITDDNIEPLEEVENVEVEEYVNDVDIKPEVEEEVEEESASESMDTVAGFAITTKVNDKVKADHVVNKNLNVSNVENISNRKNDDSNKEDY